MTKIDPVASWGHRLASRVTGLYGATLDRTADELDTEVALQERQRRKFGPRAFTTGYLAARQRMLALCRSAVRRFG